MPKVSPLQSNFNAGELSPLMAARSDVTKYKNGLEVCLNAYLLIQGGWKSRDGTKFVSEVKDSTKKTRVVRFEFSTTQAYIIEFGDLYCRFYMNHAQILSGPAYEIFTPYLEADLFQLEFTQSADVLYIAHPKYAQRKLSRTGHTAWALTTISFLDGPYLPTNATETTLTPSAATGSGITITASATTGINGNAGFKTTDVGRFIRLKEGTAWGYVKIVGWTSTTVVTVNVVNTLTNINAKVNWRLGVWSDTTGYPSAVAFFEDRLFWGGPTSYPQRLDGSKSGDYENMAPSDTSGTIAADNAVGYTLNGSTVDVVRWMMDDEKGLLVGTTGGEWLVRPSTQNEALSPTNVSAKRSDSQGSAYVQAIRAGRATLFVQRAGRKLHELAYLFEVDGFRAPDLTPLSEHITRTGVTMLAYQQEPHRRVWAVRGDGVLVGLTYERDQDVTGWHRHILGGAFGSGSAVVESIAVIPEPNGAYDELWLIVKRTINGATKRYIEYMVKSFDEGDARADAFFVDCGLTYSGAPATVISGLTHLEGQTVAIWADGATHPNRTVTAGQITLDRAASKVHVGLTYNSDGKTMKPDAGAADGTAQGKTKRVTNVFFRLHNSSGLKYGADFTSLDTVSFRDSYDPTATALPLFTGDKFVEWPGGYDGDGQICWRRDYPGPLTVLAIGPQLVTQDR